MKTIFVLLSILAFFLVPNSYQQNAYYSSSSLSQSQSLSSGSNVSNITTNATTEAAIRLINYNTGLEYTELRIGNVLSVLTMKNSFSDYFPFPIGTYEVSIISEGSIVGQLANVSFDALYYSMVVIRDPTDQSAGILLVDLNISSISPVFTSIRTVAASPGTDEEDVLVDNTLVTANLSFEETTRYFTTYPGVHSLSITPTGERRPFFSVEYFIADAGKEYSIGLFGHGFSLHAAKFFDQYDLVNIACNTTVVILPSAAESGLRFLNANPNYDELDFFVDNSVYFEDIGPNERSGYIPLLNGEHDILLHSGHNTIDEFKARMTGQFYTVVALDQSEHLLLNDGITTAIQPGSSAIRFIHVSRNFPVVSVLANGNPLFDISRNGVSPYLQMPSGLVDLSIMDTNNTNVLASAPRTILQQGRTYSIFIMPDINSRNIRLEKVIDFSTLTPQMCM